MALDPKKIQQMDKISGLSSDKVAAMDKVAGGSSQPVNQDYGAFGNILHGAGNVMRGLGMNMFADAAGGAINIPNEVNWAMNKMHGDKNALKKYTEASNKNPLLNQDMVHDAQKGNWGGVGVGMGGEALSGILSLFGFPKFGKAAVPKVVNGALDFGQVVKAPTKGLMNKAIEQGAAIATKNGAGGTLEELLPKISQAVKSKFGDTPEVNNFLNQLLREKVPNMAGFGEGTTGITPEELLKWRRQISAREGQGIFKALLGSNLEDKVAASGRGAISAYLHDVAPQTIRPDKLYSLYAKGGKFGGGPAEILAKYGLGAIVGKSAAPIVGSALSGYFNH